MRRPLQSNRPTEFSPQLPYDIFYEIFPFCSHEELCALSSVSQAFNTYVEPFLWRAVWLPHTKDGSQLEEACEAILRTPSRCSIVKMLTYRSSSAMVIINVIQGDQGLNEESRLRLSTLFYNLPNLVRLSVGPTKWTVSKGWMNIRVPDPLVVSFLKVLEPGFARTSTPLPFKLRRLDVSYILPDISQFLASQQSLERLVVWNRDSRDFLGVTIAAMIGPQQSILFPHLQSISAIPSTACALTPICPSITAVALHLKGDQDFPSRLIDLHPMDYLPLKTAVRLLDASQTLKHIGFRNITLQIAPTLHHLHSLGYGGRLESIDVNIKTLRLWCERQNMGGPLGNAEIAMDDADWAQHIENGREYGIYAAEKRVENGGKVRWHLVGWEKVWPRSCSRYSSR